MAIPNFLVTAENRMSPRGSSVATPCTSVGLTNLVQLSLHLPCLCGSWVTRPTRLKGGNLEKKLLFQRR